MELDLSTRAIVARPVAGRDPSQAPGAPTTLREATRDFESLFVSQVMRTMRRTAPEGDLLGAGEGQKLFREMLDQELARQIAASGAFGIAEALYDQLAAGEAAVDGGGTEE